MEDPIPRTRCSCCGWEGPGLYGGWALLGVSLGKAPQGWVCEKWLLAQGFLAAPWG